MSAPNSNAAPDGSPSAGKSSGDSSPTRRRGILISALFLLGWITYSMLKAEPLDTSKCAFKSITVAEKFPR